MVTRISLILIILGTVFLVGCTNKQTYTPPVNPTNPADSTTISTEDINQDFEDIEASIDSLDPDTDFPTFDADNI